MDLALGLGILDSQTSCRSSKGNIAKRLKKLSGLSGFVLAAGEAILLLNLVVFLVVVLVSNISNDQLSIIEEKNYVQARGIGAKRIDCRWRW